VQHHDAGAAAERFQSALGRAPDGVWLAPGRVNLIGEHTDYNDGYVLPLAIGLHTLVAAGRTAGASSARSALLPGEAVTFEVAQLQPGSVHGWAGYVAGVLWAMREAGDPVEDLDIVVDGDLPLGAGLSSSAALECAVALAAAELAVSPGDGLAAQPGTTPDAAPVVTPAAQPPDRWHLAALAQRAEREFVGAPTGVMDQTVVLHARPGHLVFLDTRTMRAEHIPFDLPSHDLELLVLDSRVKHALVDGQYADRRARCERAAQALGVPALRDIDADRLDDALRELPDDGLRAVTRHVVTENERTLAVAQQLRGGADPRQVGALLTASHTSLREDYQVSVPELDVAVDEALGAGAHGARMTGGGFGGCIIALVDREASHAVAHAVADGYARRGWILPRWWRVTPSDGARRVS
jgi:galactokinase